MTLAWERLLVLLWLRPFRCVRCYHRFLAFRRGKESQEFS